MDDIAVIGITGPGDILLSILQGCADGVNTGNEFPFRTQLFQDGITDTGHYVHAGDDVG